MFHCKRASRLLRTLSNFVYDLFSILIGISNIRFCIYAALLMYTQTANYVVCAEDLSHAIPGRTIVYCLNNGQVRISRAQFAKLSVWMNTGTNLNVRARIYKTWRN